MLHCAAIYFLLAFSSFCGPILSVATSHSTPLNLLLNPHIPIPNNTLSKLQAPARCPAIVNQLILSPRSSPTTPFPIPSTSLKLYTFSYGHTVPYPAFSTTLLTALDDLLQSALEGQIHEQDPIPTSISEWNEDGTSLYVQGKGLTMADLSSTLRGLGQYAQKWRFDQQGISGIWTVKQVGTGRRCDLMVSRASSKE